MSLAQIKDQVANLEVAERRQLMAYLVALQTAQDEDYKREMARKIDDNDPSHWMELDALIRRFSD